MGARSRFRQLLAEAPSDAQAVDFEDSWHTWGLFQAIARGLDEALAKHGLGEGARIGLVLENRPEHVGLIIALLASDRCIVTLSPLQPPERLAADIGRSEVPVVVATPEALAREGVADAITAVSVALRLDPDGTITEVGGAVTTQNKVNPGVVIEMLTSGTTGPPKRVQLRERQFDKALETSVPAPKPDVLFRSGTTLVTTPLVHIGGFWGAVSPLYAGRNIALMHRFQLQPWLHLVEKHRPRAAGMVPAVIRTVLDAGVPVEALSSLQVVTCGTTFCPPELADEFTDKYGIPVLSVYGATEFAGAVAGWTLPMYQKWWSSKHGSTGQAFAGVELRTTDDDGNVLGVDEVGRLELRTQQVQGGPDGWVRTSDLARIDADGFLFIIGRADDAIVRGGFKVQPDVVKKALERHPSVREAAVAPLPDNRLGNVPVAGVEVRPGAPRPTEAELIALCREQLTPYEAPVHVIVVDELPRTPSSKVSRVDLLELVTKHIAEKASAAQQSKA